MKDKFQSLKGNFLISNLAIQDSNFVETVILLLEHNHEGALGLILNRPYEISLHDAINELPSKAKDIPLYKGGPVHPGALFVLHTSGNISTHDPGIQIIPNVYLGGSRKLLNILIKGTLPFKVFNGYTGWGAEQLENEIAQNSWFMAEASKDFIFHNDSQSAWRQALDKKGGIYSYFAKTVKDPILN